MPTISVMPDAEAIRTGAEKRADARATPRLDWFRAARFGMFIHWGLYAIPAGVWRGQPIDGIGEWLMLRARVPMAELSEACRRHGLRFCFYYSQTQDWHHPGGDGNDWDYDESAKDFDGYVDNYVKPQVRELLTNYGPIGLIWFDTPKRMTPEQSRGLVELVHQLQPECLVNGRIGNGLGDYAESRDNVIPTGTLQADWEVPATINDTWGFKTSDHNWKSPAELVRKLVDVASKGGNYLLNVGPTAQGVIPQPSVERMQAIGRWLEANGEAIYATQPGPIQGQEHVRSTARGSTVYLHALHWPGADMPRAFRLEPLGARPNTSSK